MCIVTRQFNTLFYVWIISSTFSLCLESLMVMAPAVWVAHIQVDILLCYPTLAPLPPRKLDCVTRKIPRFALGINTAPPTLSWCRRPLATTVAFCLPGRCLPREKMPICFHCIPVNSEMQRVPSQPSQSCLKSPLDYENRWLSAFFAPPQLSAQFQACVSYPRKQ